MDYSTLPAYCNLENFRLFSGIDEDELGDDKAQYYLFKATQSIIEDITIPRIDEVLSINGTTVTTSNKYIADVNADGTVSPSDVSVYGWTKETDPETKTKLTVTKVYDREGKIVLSSDPSGYELVTADYSFYSHDIDLSKLDKATAYLAAFYFAIREYAFIPDYVTHGPVRWRWAMKPYMHFLHLYHQELYRIFPYSSINKKTKEMKLLRDEMR